MAWRVAKSLNVLLDQLDRRFPDRNRASDGSIGDAVHATRNSDHNPWYGPGIVTARDYTHDPASGADMFRLARELEASRDLRIKYVIFNGRIMDTRSGFAPWKWVPYTGTNPHSKHLHLSVVAGPAADDTRPWQLPMLKEGNMALTTEDLQKIGDRVWDAELMPDGSQHARWLLEMLPGIAAQLTGLTVAVGRLADAVTGDELTSAELIAAVQAGIEGSTFKLTGATLAPSPDTTTEG